MLPYMVMSKPRIYIREGNGPCTDAWETPHQTSSSLNNKQTFFSSLVFVQWSASLMVPGLFSSYFTSFHSFPQVISSFKFPNPTLYHSLFTLCCTRLDSLLCKPVLVSIKGPKQTVINEQQSSLLHATHSNLHAWHSHMSLILFPQLIPSEAKVKSV